MSVNIPDTKEILASGLQFGHSASRWNPLMSKFIWGQKNGIHVIDIAQTKEAIERAVQFVQEAASKGDIVFVGTKRQATQIIQDNAVRAGAHFFINRWPGGMLTNFKMSQRSLQRLLDLERMFEEGVEGRTKYEVAKMKVEWERLSRIYGGAKNLGSKPQAIVVVDPKFEKVAIREARRLAIPIVALADTNCDPSMIDYVIPGNDDALKAIDLVVKVLADAVLAGNEGKGVKHEFKDYSGLEVKILKANEESEDLEEVVSAEEEKPAPTTRVSEKPKAKAGKSTNSGAGSGAGILGRSKEDAKVKAGK